MGVTEAGTARFYKGGLVSQAAYLALFVAGVEVAGGGYARLPVPAGNWTIDGEKVYLSSANAFPSPTADWGAVDSVKLMSAPAGGQVLVEWSGDDFMLLDPEGAPLSNIGEDGVVIPATGEENGLSVTVPLSKE